MRTVLALWLALGSVAVAAEGPKDPYQLRVYLRTGDHPALTAHFRHEVRKSIASSMEAGLGPLGTVEVIDLNELAIDKRDPLAAIAIAKGLEGLDGSPATGGPKTHFVFVEFSDGKYDIRSRQHDGATGFVTPIVRRTVHPDRGFVGRLAGLAIAQDFGLIGTFDAQDATAAQFNVRLQAGELGPQDAWVKKGDVFAIVHVRQGGRSAKAKGTWSNVVGTRIEGALLHVVDGPKNGFVTCKMYNRYRNTLPKDAFTLGYRAIRLGTGESPLKLRLVDQAGNPYRPDTVQPRVGVNDYPDAQRDREEMAFSDGVFTSRETFKNIAFVTVRAGDTQIARIPIEIYEGQIASRKVDPRQAQVPPVRVAVLELADRIRSARVIQARCFDEISTMQEKEKPKALAYGETAHTSLEREANVLREELGQVKNRFKAESNQFDSCDADLKALEAKTKELRAYLGKLRDAIRVENDPAAVAARKGIEGLLAEADLLVRKADYDQAIAKYEAALKLAEKEPGAAANIQTTLENLKREWEVKDADHAAARKFVYEVWATLDKPTDVRDQLPNARKSLEKCKAVGDRITLLKMSLTSPGVEKRFEDALVKLRDEAVEDEDRRNLEALLKVSEELVTLLNDIKKAVGADR